MQNQNRNQNRGQSALSQPPTDFHDCPIFAGPARRSRVKNGVREHQRLKRKCSLSPFSAVFEWLPAGESNRGLRRGLR